MTPAATVALVHGWGGSPDTTWRAAGLPAALARAGVETVRPALPGHGITPQSPEPEDYRDIHIRLDTLLPLGPLDAVGYSLGAKLLLKIAAEDPSRFRRLVLVGLGVNVHGREAGDLVAEALVGSAVGDIPAALAQVIDAARATGNYVPAMCAVIQRPSEPLTPEDLARVTCPVLVVAGKADAIGRDAHVLAEELPNAELLVLPSANHVSLPADPRFHKAAVTFLARH